MSEMRVADKSDQNLHSIDNIVKTSSVSKAYCHRTGILTYTTSEF